MTNVLFMIVTMGWTNIPGDFHREGGSNYVHQGWHVETNWYRLETCTNWVTKSCSSGPTNQWVPLAPPQLPGSPVRGLTPAPLPISIPGQGSKQ